MHTGMENLYFVILRFPKYISKICVVLVVLLLIFVYFNTLNGKHTREAFGLDSSRNHKIYLSSLDERIERDEYAVNKGRIQLCI